MQMVGSGEKITGEELLKRYTAGERNFPLITLNDEKSVLVGADLSGINLMGAYLHYALWWNVNLSGACLLAAELSGVSMDGADLSDADLTSACLWGTNFTNANLSNCILKGANLRRAILWNANLRGAVLDGAILAYADFTGAKYFTINQHMTGILFWNTTMPDGTVIEGPTYIN
ncbi:pentapeptide repeat-containing protein [Nostoc sp.]|uniref:pentapeptide repeat-containing protein n=1 Tax=Nostoc sp. TaxID=1180 RepID=UPI002FF762D2